MSDFKEKLLKWSRQSTENRGSPPSILDREFIPGEENNVTTEQAVAYLRKNRPDLVEYIKKHYGTRKKQ